jgi:hypothetical protein
VKINDFYLRVVKTIYMLQVVPTSVIYRLFIKSCYELVIIRFVGTTCCESVEGGKGGVWIMFHNGKKSRFTIHVS